MALQKDIELGNGLNVSGAYFRIDTISGNKDNIQINLNSYVNKEAFQESKSYLEQQIYLFIPSVSDGAENFIKQGYGYLKTLDEYMNAIDC